MTRQRNTVLANVTQLSPSSDDVNVYGFIFLPLLTAVHGRRHEKMMPHRLLGFRCMCLWNENWNCYNNIIISVSDVYEMFECSIYARKLICSNETH